MSSPRCIIPSNSSSEGERVGAKEARSIYCSVSTNTTVATGIAFLPKFTTAGAYMAYKRACNAQNATTFRSIPPCTPGTINDIEFDNFAIASDPFDPPYESYEYRLDVSWSPMSGISSYTVTASGNGVTNYVSISIGATSATVYFNWVEPYGDVIFTVTGTLGVCPYIGTRAFASCFLEGALVTMADGSTKPIETVAVGDLVLGAFGEINQVLALHRPLLGDNLMCRINEEHTTTNHHPHISVDKQFYCGNPGLVNTTIYGRTHKVIDGSGAVVDRLLHGLRPDRVLPLVTGIQLKTVEGSRTVRSFEPYALPPETQLYNLVVGGSHTYHVEGYAVTGWPHEDDFNYDTWEPII
jgi:hypothetical protein